MSSKLGKSRSSHVNSIRSIGHSSTTSRASKNSLARLALGYDQQFIDQYMPSYLGNATAEDNQYDWNTFMNRPMSPQQHVIFKIQMFCENKFDIVIVGMTYNKSKLLGNMLFKSFLEPLDKDLNDYIGDKYALERGAKCSEDEEKVPVTAGRSLMNEMLAIKEDNLRYSHISIFTVYGLGLRVHVATDPDKSLGIAIGIAQKQIAVIGSYLNFKRKYPSGWGMNSIWIILEYNTKLSPINECLLDLMYKLFGKEVFDSAIFLLEQNVPKDTSKDFTDAEKSSIETSRQELKLVRKLLAKKCTIQVEDVSVISIEPLSWTTQAAMKSKDEKKDPSAGNSANDEGLIKVNWVASTLQIANMAAKKTYQNPNPFEPAGMEYHEAITAFESIKKKHLLPDVEWCKAINFLYTMVPN